MCRFDIVNTCVNRISYNSEPDQQKRDEISPRAARVENGFIHAVKKLGSKLLERLEAIAGRVASVFQRNNSSSLSTNIQQPETGSSKPVSEAPANSASSEATISGSPAPVVCLLGKPEPMSLIGSEFKRCEFPAYEYDFETRKKPENSLIINGPGLLVQSDVSTPCQKRSATTENVAVAKKTEVLDFYCEDNWKVEKNRLVLNKDHAIDSGSGQ